MMELDGVRRLICQRMSGECSDNRDRLLGNCGAVEMSACLPIPGYSRRIPYGMDETCLRDKHG